MAGLPISIGSVGVRIVPDMRGFVEDITAKSKAIPDVTVGVKLDDAIANLQLDMLDAKLRAISGNDINVRVNLDGVALAEGQLALFDLEEGATVAEGAMTALSTSVDEVVASMDDIGASIDVADGALADVAAGAESAGAAAATGGASFSVLGAAILGVIVLAGPIVAVLTPAVFALGAVAASAAAGFGVFALAVMPVAKAVEAFHKEQLDPTTANMQALQRSLIGMPGAGRGLVMFLGTTLYSAFDRLQRAAEKGLFPGLLAGIKAVMPLVGPLTKFVGSLAHTMGDLAAQAGRALNDKFWRGFFAFITAQAGPTLKTFGKVIGDVAHGLAAMMIGFGPIVQQIGKGVLGLAQAFAKWASGDGFQKFLAYVTANAPTFVKLLGDIIVIAGKLIIALAPLGALLVKLITPIANFLASLSPNELLAIAAAVGVMVGGFTGLGVAVVAVAALIVNNWGHIKGFFEAIGHWFTGPFIGFFRDMGQGVIRIVGDVVGFLGTVGSRIIAVFGAAGSWLIRAGRDIITGLWNGIRDVLRSVMSFLTSIPGRIEALFKDAGTWLLDAGKAIIGGLWDGIKGGFGGIIHGLHSFVSGLEFWKGSPSLHDMAPTLLAAAGQKIAQGLGDGMKRQWPSVIDVLHAAGGSVPQTMAAAITAGTPQVTKAVQGMSQAIQKEISNLQSQLSSLQSSKSSLASAITSSLGGFDLTQAGTQVTSTTGGTPVYYNYPGEGSGWFTPPTSSSTSTLFTAGGIQGYLDTYLSQEQTVLRLLGQLSGGKHHLTDAEISMFEEMPVAQSLPILKALASGTQAQLGGILGDINDINRLSKLAGQGQAQQVYDPQIKTVVARLDNLERAVKHVGADTAGALNNATATAKHKGTARASS